jgi:hydroxymethylbilane synthase
LRQAEIVAERLNRNDATLSLEIVPLTTTGDKQSEASLLEIGGRGVFVTELERALQTGEIDLAVHSLKDVPSQLAAGLAIAATLPRETPNDVLVSRDGASLRDLPRGARVGSGSPRRRAQLLAARPDLQLADIRGNVDTRLRKTANGEFAAIVLAAAGLLRLGRLAEASEVLPPEIMLPAAGQGILAIEARSDDEAALALAEAADDADTQAAALCERAFQRRLGGGCQAAIAALATVEAGSLDVRGLVADGEGRRFLRGSLSGSAPGAEALGTRLAEELLAQGAAELLEDVRG